MSANNDQATTPNVPTLCKMGCGFFGSEATGGCCSKCWMTSMKNKPTTPPVPATTSASESPTKVQKEVTTLEKSSTAMNITEETTKIPTATGVVKKKKKKKTGYKNMMATMMAGSDKKDIAKEKEILAKGLGGGAFSKIEKI